MQTPRQFVLAGLLAGGLLWTTTATAQQPAQVSQPAIPTTPQPTNAKAAAALTASGAALATADQVIYDRDLSTMTASGHVEIDQEGRILLADTLSYNLRDDVIIAAGHVSLTSTDGNVTFADYIELSGDLKNAIARRIRMLMVDDSRLAAKSGRRLNDLQERLEDAVYTACQPCEAHPERAPLWDIRAKQIIHDDSTHLIQYKDATLEAFGVPILYTPYFSNPDPTAGNQSGLLWPSMISNRIIGQALSWPFYQVISPNQDVIVSPELSTRQGVGLSVAHRLLFDDGSLKTVASVGNEPSSHPGQSIQTGWQIKSDAEFDLDDGWRAGWNVWRASDRDYLRYYDYTLPQPFLQSRPFLENFTETNYAAVEAYSFQSQTDVGTAPIPGVPNTTPSVLPLVSYNYLSQPLAHGSYMSFDTHAASVTRSGGQQSSRRVNTLTGWHQPFSFDDGEQWELTTNLRADYYDSTDLLGRAPGRVDANRVLPQVAMQWRYPFAKIGARSSQMLTPIVMAAAGPDGGNPASIPNEDSLDFELDDTNIFSPSPFSGYDRVDLAPRIAYGGEYSMTLLGGQSFDAVLGQSYQPEPEHIFQTGTGLDNHWSDIVGRTSVSPNPNLNVYYRFRVEQDDFAMRRSEVGFNAGPKALNLDMSYVFLARLNTNSPYPQREQVSATLSSKLDRNWAVQVFTNQDLGAAAQPLASGGSIVYDDDCVSVSLQAGVRHTYVNTTLAGHYVMLTINLKTLTQLPVSLSP